MLINCDVHPFLRATLSFKSGNLTYLRPASDLHVDNKKIKLASKNVFNITRLAYDDSGQYICTIIVLNASGIVEGEVTRHYLIVLKEGKTCMDRYLYNFLLNFIRISQHSCNNKYSH